MQERHKDHNRYFNEQAECMRRYVIPYIEQQRPVTPTMRVLEIGCGEAGNLLPFLDMGCECVGIDIDQPKIDVGKIRFADHPNSARMHLICNDIYKVRPEDLGEFDLIVLRDVIEHIPHQEQFMHNMKRFMNDRTIVFFGFPVWCNPFGGHQQICRNRVLSHLPWMTFSRARSTADYSVSVTSPKALSTDSWTSRPRASAFTVSSVYCAMSISMCCSTPTISSTPTTKSSSDFVPVSYPACYRFRTFPTSTPQPCTTS